MSSANNHQNYQEDFLKIRPRLFALAYKMTKSVVDAEDIIQETYLAIGSMKAGSIRKPDAYLVKVVTNRCLQILDQRKTTSYPGPDLPEPLEDGFLPEAIGQDLSYGLLLLLKRLKPAERAVFILRESFDFEYDLIAGILETSPDNCRQILHRAKDRLRQMAQPSPTSVDQLREIMQLFLAAATSGDPSPLIARLREDVIVYSDGGGKRLAALNPIRGSRAAANFMMGIYNKGSEDVSLSVAQINGETAVVLHDINTGLPESVLFFEFDEAKLSAIYMVRNPDKLKGVQNKDPLGPIL